LGKATGEVMRGRRRREKGVGEPRRRGHSGLFLPLRAPGRLPLAQWRAVRLGWGPQRGLADLVAPDASASACRNMREKLRGGGLTGKTVSIPKRVSRLAVPNPRRQPEKMLEAVANHSAQVVVDELAWIEDSKVVEIIAGKGVWVIATVHGSDLREASMNPVYFPITGVAKDPVKRTLVVVKPPVFKIAAEAYALGRTRLYRDLAKTVEAILEGESPPYLDINLRTGEVHHVA
jgi:hypothetical protein